LIVGPQFKQLVIETTGQEPLASFY